MNNLQRRLKNSIYGTSGIGVTCLYSTLPINTAINMLPKNTIRQTMYFRNIFSQNVGGFGC